MLANRYTKLQELSRREQFLLLFVASIFLKSVSFASTLHESLQKNVQLRGYTKYFVALGISTNYFERMNTFLNNIVKQIGASQGRLYILKHSDIETELSILSESGR